jgi:2-amino-4-hydroxy-6-hydroxymethyldihydropteridine diphosphokinase
VTERAFVALGSNLGDRRAFLSSATAALALLPYNRIAGASPVEETVPFGPAAQGPYLNQMIALDTALPPMELLAALQGIERRLGRVRRERWGARTIDLDLVRYGAREVRTPALMLPHPGLGERAFWQRELAQLATMLPERG